MGGGGGGKKFTDFTMKIRRYETIWKTLRWKTVCCLDRGEIQCALSLTVSGGLLGKSTILVQ